MSSSPEAVTFSACLLSFHPLCFALLPHPEPFKDRGYLVHLPILLMGRCKMSLCVYLYRSKLHRNPGACKRVRRCPPAPLPCAPAPQGSPPSSPSGTPTRRQPSRAPRLLIPTRRPSASACCCPHRCLLPPPAGAKGSPIPRCSFLPLGARSKPASAAPAKHFCLQVSEANSLEPTQTAPLSLW